ncbi:MAG TPA: hypothetical protein VMC10_14205 [Stellaceae bacterium]|nr:hypothetical protein [Stellaceae bacterium]HUN46565.1 hypothetical protein [Stellaceae bacterium]
MAGGIFRRAPRPQRAPRRLAPALVPAAPPPVISPPPLAPPRPRWTLFRRRAGRRPTRHLAPALVPTPVLPSSAPPPRRPRPAWWRLRRRASRRPLRQPAVALAAGILPSSASGGFVLHYSGVLVPDSAALASTDLGTAVFDGFVWRPMSAGLYRAPGITLAKTALVRTYATTVAVLGPGSAGKIDPQLQIRYSQSGAQDPAMWTGDGNPMWAADPSMQMWSGLSPWQNWTKGELITGFIQHQLAIDFTEGLPIVQQFTPVIDQPALADGANGVAVAAGGSRIDFANGNFLEPPAVTASVVSVTSGAVGSASAVDIDSQGFTAHVFGSDGADAGGVINWIAHN